MFTIHRLEQDNELPDVYKKVAVAAKDEKKEADWKADVQKAASDKGDGSVGVMITHIFCVYERLC